MWLWLPETQNKKFPRYSRLLFCRTIILSKIMCNLHKLETKENETKKKEDRLIEILYLSQNEIMEISLKNKNWVLHMLFWCREGKFGLGMYPSPYFGLEMDQATLQVWGLNQLCSSSDLCVTTGKWYRQSHQNTSTRHKKNTYQRELALYYRAIEGL